ncbi:MAG: hypothetical protein N4A71_06715 [Carboxylicivirga sp.]|jgi:hypothetical protein|nr:hypothetical protein [Carboxylicivirga sp.]
MSCLTKHYFIRIILLISFLSNGLIKINSQASAETLLYKEDVIKFDTITRQLDRLPPFDKGFRIEIPIRKNDVIVSAFMYKVYLNRKLFEPTVIHKKDRSNRYTKSNVINRRYSEDSIQVRDVRLIKDLNKFNSKEYDLIENNIKNGKLIDQKYSTIEPFLTLTVDTISQELIHLIVPPLPPNFLFDISLTKRLTEEHRNTLVKVTRFIYEGKEAVAKKKYTDLVKCLEPDTVYNIFPLSVFKSYFSSFYNFESKYYESHAKAIFDSINNNTTWNNVILSDFNNLNWVAIDSIFSKYKFDTKTLNNLYLSTQLDVNNWNPILRGRISLDDQTNGLLDPLDINGRIRNLEVTSKSIDSLLESCTRLNIKSSGVTYEFGRKIRTIRDSLRNNQEELKSIKDSIYQPISDVSYNRIIGVNTFTQDIKTSSGNTVLPDFGLVNIFAFGNSDMTYFLRPYLGVNISFRPINKNQRISQIQNRTIWHSLSWTLGLTLGSIENEEFDDLFGGMTFVTGVGIRVHRFIRVTPGFSLFKEKDINPLISESTLEIAPFVSISFDLDVSNNVQKFYGKIYK